MKKHAVVLGLAALLGATVLTLPTTSEAWWGSPYNGYPNYYGGYYPYGGGYPYGGYYPNGGYYPYGGGYYPYYNNGPGPTWMPWNW